jgi:hypothetical protein
MTRGEQRVAAKLEPLLPHAHRVEAAREFRRSEFHQLAAISRILDPDFNDQRFFHRLRRSLPDAALSRVLPQACE